MMSDVRGREEAPERLAHPGDADDGDPAQGQQAIASDQPTMTLPADALRLAGPLQRRQVACRWCRGRGWGLGTLKGKVH